MNVVLHQPEIPQNTGNIGRTCVATGAKLWLIRPLGFRVDDQRMRRAGLDYWQHLDIEIVDSWTAFMEQHATARLWFFTKTAERVYTDVKFQRDDFLVFGSETRGLPPSILAQGDSTLRIPQSDNVRSLNLSNSVAIAVYEGLRQLDCRDV